jgi:putative hydrolase of the HAD superfamily
VKNITEKEEVNMSENAPKDNKARRCSVFLSPTGDDFAYLDGLIREMCARHDLPPFEPHVTLYSGMFCDTGVLRRAIDAAVAGVPPITLSVRSICCTREYFKTLFIEFEEHPLLRHIHDRMKQECCDLSPYEFAPHLSLLYADLPFGEKEALAARTHLDRSELHFDQVEIVTPLNRVEGWRDTMQWQNIYRTKLAENKPGQKIRAVLFDFGGVIATEGFRDGLHAAARRQGLDPGELLRIGMDAIYDSGYITGHGSETGFWGMMRRRSGLAGTDVELTAEILTSFAVRPQMLEAVRRLRREGIITVMLSDQTDWLERLDERDGFYREFDRVFNSYRLGKGKRDADIFTDVVALLGIEANEALFVDDMPANVERSRSMGLRGMLFENEEEFLAEMERLLFKQPCIREGIEASY